MLTATLHTDLFALIEDFQQSRGQRPGLRFLGLARLGLGELTRFSTPLVGLFGPDEAAAGDVLSTRSAMVVAGPLLDLQRARVSLGLTLLPDS